MKLYEILSNDIGNICKYNEKDEKQTGGMVMRKKQFKRLVVVCAAVGMLATSMSAFAAESYTVQSGDNLKKIAKQLYGDSFKWEVIYEANKGSIKNPNLIYEGQVFTIPDSDAAPAPTAEALAPAAETPAAAPASETPAPAPVAETPAAPAPAAETPAAVPAISSLPIPAATVKVEKGGGFDITGSGRSIWCQTYDSGSNKVGGDIGWDGKLTETMAESTDAYGVTYRSYAFEKNEYSYKYVDPAENAQRAKDALAGYIAANPDSSFTALVKASGSGIVIVTYPALFPDGIEGCIKYPDINLQAWDCFLVDGKLYILCSDETFDWLEGTARPDVYIPQYLNSAFTFLSSII